MNEMTPNITERRLWYEGVNHTADGVVIHPDSAQILLIQRKTGEWALPGGFVDESERALESAIREIKEETDLDVHSDAPLVFRGIVDDPRNSDDAWIETDAHLFLVDRAQKPHAGDDAADAAWHPLNNLPDLYASHAAIVGRALDHLTGMKLFDTFSRPDTATRVDAGHMEYNKSICRKDGHAVFAKQHDFKQFDDTDRANRSYQYLEKEAFTMAHLRRHNFSHIPSHSALYGDTLAMDALQAEDGWQWRAQPETIHAYIADSLAMFETLEHIPIPADSFTIEPSYESFTHEGWRTLTDETKEKITERLYQFLPRLDAKTQLTAQSMVDAIDTLQHAHMTPRETPSFVFCHHDVRQSNLAWHPEHGSKLVDWSWAGLGETGSDQTSFLIDLHKGGHDISSYYDAINPYHCLTLIGFWLAHSTWPAYRDDTVRFQQFLSAVSAYDILQS